MPFVQVEDLCIHYEIEGQGEPLVLLHGMSNNAQSWKNQMKELRKGYTVIAWDAPGYGQSSDPKEIFKSFSQFADVLYRFLEALAYESVYLLGHSMGAVIALDFAHRYSHRVKSLIIADPTRGSAALSKEENEVRLKNRLHSINTLEPHVMAQKRINELVSSNASQEVKQEVLKIMSQVRPAGYQSVAYSLYHVNQMPILPAITVPTMVICGELDKVTPVSESRIFYENLPNSELFLIPGTGHLCYQEDPVRFNSLVQDFFKEG